MKNLKYLTVIVLALLIVNSISATTHTAISGDFGYLYTGLNASDEDIINVPNVDYVKVTIYMEITKDNSSQGTSAYLDCSFSDLLYDDFYYKGLSTETGEDKSFLRTFIIPNNSMIYSYYDADAGFEGYYSIYYEAVDGDAATLISTQSDWMYNSDENNFYLGYNSSVGGATQDFPLDESVLHIKKDGYLGIGVTPSHQLDIGGNTRLSFNTTDNTYLKFGNFWDSQDVVSMESKGNAQVVIDCANQSTFKSFSVKKNSSDATTSLLSVNENGAVSIATTQTSYKLNVGGGTTFSVDTEDSEYLKFGNYRSSFDILSMESKGSAQVVIDSDNNNGTGAKAYFDVRNDGTENAPILRVHQSGRVGIGGVEDPDATLHVDGDSYVTGSVGIGGEADNVKLHVYGQSKLVGNSYLTGGKVGIGTTSPDAKLHVNGITKLEGDVYNTGVFRTTEVIIEVEGPHWPDYVFESDYNLLDLMEVEAHIAEKGHLPSIPSAAQVAEEGVSLGEMNKLLLQKVEELTLYIIEQQKQIDELKTKVN